jgi:hypothetical protein
MRKTEGRNHFLRPRHRWEFNSGMGTKATGWDCVEWIYLAQNRNKCEGCCGKDDELSVSIKCREFRD